MATAEHCIHLRHVFSIEIAYVEGIKILAAAEHRTHLYHILSIELGDIDRVELLATAEHRTHILHFLGIEVADVERVKTLTAREHSRHICHILGIEIFYSVDSGQFFHSGEHCCSAGELLIVHECSIESNIYNIVSVGLSSPLKLIHTENNARTFRLQNIIIECESIIFEYGISLWPA